MSIHWEEVATTQRQFQKQYQDNTLHTSYFNPDHTKPKMSAEIEHIPIIITKSILKHKQSTRSCMSGKDSNAGIFQTSLRVRQG